jgi:MFS family permease
MYLYCKDDVEIGFLGSSFLIGTFVGSFFFPRAADIIGRKPIFLSGLMLYIVVCIGFLFVKSLNMAYALLFIGGLSETGAYYVAYVYCVEMMPLRFQNYGGLLIFLVFAFVKMFFGIYFWKISNNWLPMAYIAIVLDVISLVLCLLFLPDSPRYYYSTKKFYKCR